MPGLLIVNPFASGVSESRLAGVQARCRRERRRCSPTRPVTRRSSRATQTAGWRRSTSSPATAPTTRGWNAVSGETPLGFVPGGGTSVLPRALGLPRDPRRRPSGSQPARHGGSGSAASTAAASASRRPRRRRRARPPVDDLGRHADGRRPGDLAFAWAGVRLLAEKRGHMEPVLELEGSVAPRSPWSATAPRTRTPVRSRSSPCRALRSTRAST